MKLKLREDQYVVVRRQTDVPRSCRWVAIVFPMGYLDLVGFGVTAEKAISDLARKDPRSVEPYAPVNHPMESK